MAFASSGPTDAARNDGLARGLIIVASGLLAGAAYQWGWPTLPAGPFWIRVTATLAAIWAVGAWALREPAAEPGPESNALRGSPLFDACLRGVHLCGGASCAIIAVIIIKSLWTRVVATAWDDPVGASALPPGPVSDMAALGLGLMFWRFARADRAQPVAALLLASLVVTWLSLMIPGGLFGDPDALLARSTRLPAWWTWTLNLQAGIALVLAVTALLRTRAFKRRRRAAWPDRLEVLLEPYPALPGFNLIFSMAATVVLLVGVFHLIRPGGVGVLAGLVGVAAAGAAAIACLMSAHRRWSENIADLGLTLVTICVVTLASMWVGGDAGEYAHRLPPRLNAALFGLAAMAFVYLWLAGFWQQQLYGGAAWTTAGRMIPHVERAGFMIAALGVLVAFQLALWPRTQRLFAPDATPWRWVFGLAGILALAAVCSRFARHRHNIPLAMLSLAALVGAALFGFVRWPATDFRGWIVQHIALVFAACALPVIAASWRAEHSRAWHVFSLPLRMLALMAIPALAILQLIGRTGHAWVRPATLATLAIVFLVDGVMRKQRGLEGIGAVLGLAAAALAAMIYAAV